jgi:hypothetical protein
MNPTTQEELKQEIHDILQEEIASKVPFESRYAEESLKRGLERAEAALTTLSEREREKGRIEQCEMRRKLVDLYIARRGKSIPNELAELALELLQQPKGNK